MRAIRELFLMFFCVKVKNIFLTYVYVCVLYFFIKKGSKKKELYSYTTIWALESPVEKKT